MRKNKFPALVCRLVLAAVLFAALALPLFFNREVNAAGPSVKILTPANGSVLTLDYNEFNLSVHYYVDVEKNAGSIFLTFYNDHYQKVKLGDNAIGAYSPGHAYPLDWTSNVRAWVPSPPAGTYKIRAELWRWELQSGIYRHIEIVATDEISVTIPVSGSNTVAPAAPASTPKPGTSTATAPLPAKTTAAPASTTTAPSAIYVYSTPGDAEIWMNGKYRVNTNFSPTGVGFTDLQPGSYNVTLRKEGYKDYTETVNLKSNEIRDIKAVLQQGLTPTGWIVVNSDPAGASVIINNKQIATSQATITEVQPGSYNLTLKKDGYEDWNDTITVSAGKITRVDASLSSSSGGFPVGAAVGGAAALAVIGGLVKFRSGRGKNPSTAAPVAASAKDLYQEWWAKASPADRSNWGSFEKFLNSRFGAPRLDGFINEYGQPSWASAYTSWQADVKKGSTKASFDDWAKAQYANQQVVNDMKATAERNKDFRPKDIVDASQKYSDALRNKERFEKLAQIRKAVSGDSKLSDFVSDASNFIVDSDGQVDPNKLNRLEGTLKNWINRDKMSPQAPDYTYSDALNDSVRQGSQNIIVRAGAAYLTGGYSEMALNPISAVSTMRQSIMDGKSTLRAVADGYVQSSFELGLGESGRLVKYAQPYIKGVKESYNLTSLSKLNPELSSEVSTINQLANQADDVSRYSRDAYMKSTEMVNTGKAVSTSMDEAEKLALKLNNNADYRKLMAENSSLVPSKVKDVMGIAKQKAYEQARNNAVNDVMSQISKDGVPAGDKAYFIQQTGTHARPGNPGWNSLKSDFDHTVDFGSSDYNQLYEQKLNAHLEGQGTSASALDANVYGPGTSSKGAYSGGAMKFVENYNQTNGSDLMIRSNANSQTLVSRETPQTVNSLLSKMQPEDIASARSNYQDFFQKSLEKGGSMDNMITNSSKEVSRTAGQYSVNYAEHFQNTGTAGYKPPDAARVADLIKKQGYSVDSAMQKAGYNGSKSDLLNDFKKIMRR